jgi:hypothetical protein
MAKTQAPSQVAIGKNLFVTNALPDPFDERDLMYRPRLAPLPDQLDRRDTPRKDRYVLTQDGNSCTGHAVATVINIVLVHSRKLMPGRSRALLKVSPYMLYWLARRYDEFEGEDDAGSSLRAVFKAWFHHGVCPEKLWRALNTEVNLEDKDFQTACREQPLGAYYRVNPYRLDDMQSALSELNAIAVSGVIHNGWIEPAKERGPSGKITRVIRRPDRPEVLGGHAFAVVGYNRVGFLVQNSWGEDWGKGGFATLPYDDWLDNAYDAWVARPGVPQTPFDHPRSRTTVATGGAIVTGPGPDMERLSRHVVNLGNDGRLSRGGRFVSTPTQIDKLFTSMDRQHREWLAGPAGDQPASPKRHIMLWAHGGMVSEASAINLADRHLQWWLNNHVYPITFAWQTGPAETLLNSLVELVKGKLPFGGVRFDLIEQFDRLVEKMARSHFKWAWDEMKENAWAASEALTAHEREQIVWPPDAAHETRMAALPGASLFVTRLAEYIAQCGPENVRLHLAGHSAGTIFHAALLERLAEAGLEVETLALLAGGLRVDDFRLRMLPHLGKSVRHTTFYNLSHARELDDRCPPQGLAIYHKSLLYMVSRGLEPALVSGRFEVPLIGLQGFFDQPVAGPGSPTLTSLIQGKAEVVIAPQSAPSNARSDAKGHGEFDDDVPTLTSVLLRVLGASSPQAVHTYQPHAAPLAAAVPPAGPAAAGLPTNGKTNGRRTPRTRRRGAKTLTRAAATAGPGEEPAQETELAVKPAKATKKKG